MRFSISSILAAMLVCAVVCQCVNLATVDYRKSLASQAVLKRAGAAACRVEAGLYTHVRFDEPIRDQRLGRVGTITSLTLNVFVVDRASLGNVARLRSIDGLTFRDCSLADEDALGMLQSTRIRVLHFWNVPLSQQSVALISAIPGLEALTFVNADRCEVNTDHLAELIPEVYVRFYDLTDESLLK